MTRRARLPVETFKIPIQKIRRGYYSAVYFWRTKRILEKIGYKRRVLVQVFQKNNAVLAGTDEAIAILQLCSGSYSDSQKAFSLFDRYLEQEHTVNRLRVRREYDELRKALDLLIELEMELDKLWELPKKGEVIISSLYDGDHVEPWETTMTIEGNPKLFAHLESVYLGVLARRTLVATNVAKVVAATNGKPVLFFADRFDHYENQTGDGYAAMMSGAYAVATDVMGEWWGKKGAGTIPHALIACFHGNTAGATLAFAKEYPDIPTIALVDFHNNCVGTSLDVAREFKAEGLKLWGVRLDTSETMVDHSIVARDQMGQERPTGVNPLLVCNVREALNKEGFFDVKIVVSGGFNEQRIEHFEKHGIPVDAYGVGSSLLKGSNDLTADIVLVDGIPMAKAGRWFRLNPRLERVEQ